MKTSKLSITSLALAAILSASLASPLWAQSQDQSDDVEPPFLEPGASEPVYHTLLDLEGIELPILTLSNPSSDRTLELQATAVAGDDHRRSLTLEIEAGGNLTVSLESSPAFAKLTIVARGPFTGELADARSDVVKPLPVAVHGAEPEARERSADKGGTLVCGGDWTLTCIYPSNCNYTSPALPGEVILDNGVHKVTWNQQYWTGDWTTSNSAGCWVNWREDPLKPGCPKSARNCYWQLYSVSGTVSYP